MILLWSGRKSTQDENSACQESLISLAGVDIQHEHSGNHCSMSNNVPTPAWASQHQRC